MPSRVEQWDNHNTPRILSCYLDRKEYVLPLLCRPDSVIAPRERSRLQQGMRLGERRGRRTYATKRGDGISGKLHCLYRQTMSRWGVASRGCTLGVKELPLKGPVRREAGRQEAGLG